MNRPRVICELSAYLTILLRWGLRASDEAEAGALLLDSAAEIEGTGPAPSFFLHFYAVSPDRRAARAQTLFEAADAAQEGLRMEIRRPPLWVVCRYLVGVRGRNREEEEEMLAALLRTLHDHPVLTGEHVPSLRGPAGGDRYPLELIEEREGWLLAGLRSPRPVVAFQVSVPIASSLTEPFQPVLERDVRLGEFT